MQPSVEVLRSRRVVIDFAPLGVPQREVSMGLGNSTDRGVAALALQNPGSAV